MVYWELWILNWSLWRNLIEQTCLSNLYSHFMIPRNSSEGLSYLSANHAVPLVMVFLLTRCLDNWTCGHVAIIENRGPLCEWHASEIVDLNIKKFWELILDIIKGLAVIDIGLTARSDCINGKSLRRNEFSSFEGRRKTDLSCHVKSEIFKAHLCHSSRRPGTTGHQRRWCLQTL